LQHLKFGQVYKAPSAKKFKRKGYRHVDTHAIVLVGAGRSKGVDYFHFLNSWNPTYCTPITKEGKVRRGGIGKVRASDVLPDPIMIKPGEFQLLTSIFLLMLLRNFLMCLYDFAFRLQCGLEE
jgi:hypothetical protein